MYWILVYPIRIQEDVGAFLGDEQSANEAIADWQERYQKYKLMESHLQQKREELKKKIPDIEGTLELLTQVIKKRVCSLSHETALTVQLHTTIRTCRRFMH